MWKDSEIVKSYAEAKHKQKQLEILAQLNACTEQQIVGVLLNNGYEQLKQFNYPTPIKKVSNEIKKDEQAVKKLAADIKPITSIKDKVQADVDKEQASPEFRPYKKVNKQTKTVEVPMSMLISDDELRQRYIDNGESIQSIAKSLGISDNRLTQHLVAHNIVRKRKPGRKPSISTNDMADALVADRLIDAKIKTFLDAADNLRKKADEFEKMAEDLKKAKSALSIDVSKLSE